MANYNCEECGVMMDADDEGEPELCPRCGKQMSTFSGAALKNLCGGGVSGMKPGSNQPASQGSRLPSLPTGLK
ncbi:MAG: hypothetical protein WD602_02015 [Actinomycetota bacterium]